MLPLFRPPVVASALLALAFASPIRAAVVDLSQNLSVPLRWNDAPTFRDLAADLSVDPRDRRRAMSVGPFRDDPIQTFGSVVTRYFCGLNLEIPDNSAVGVSSEKVVSGVSGVIASLQVELHIAPLANTTMFNGDYHVTLTHDSGYAVLLNRTGRRDGFSAGYGDNGFRITLDDTSGGDVHAYRVTATGSHTTPLSNTDTPIALTGTWQPDGRSADPAQVGLGSARDATLARVAGLDPNGVWTLHLSDLAAEGQGELVEWSLHFTLVPEPAEIAVGGAALLGAFALARSRRPSR